MVSQTLGLERLTPPAKEIVQTSELSKEALIQASREKNPEKQVKILKKASSESQTIKQIREDLIDGNSSSDEGVSKKSNSTQKLFKKVDLDPRAQGLRNNHSIQRKAKCVRQSATDQRGF